MKALEHIEEVAANLTSSGRPALAAKLQGAVNELRAQFKPTDSPFDESAPANSQHFKTWVAIMDALDGSGFDWRPRTPQTCAKDAAVAAIRSMAARCSARPAPAIPIAWPEPVASEQLSALVWAQGYLSGTGYDRVVESLAQIETWLRKNGCDQIR